MHTPIALLLELGAILTGLSVLGTLARRYALSPVPLYLLAGLALAGATYVSSSGIIARLLGDLRRLGNRETPAVLSVLVMEDFAMAAYLPLLAVITSGGTWWQALLAVLAATAAVAATIAASARWSHHVGRILTHPEPEQVLLRVLGITLVVAALAETIHVSAAVGAFLIGLALTGTAADRARAALSPLRDLFAAVFFLALGLAVAPGDLMSMLPAATALAVVTASTKLASGWCAARREGAGHRGRLRAGTALIARGEFSVVIVVIVGLAGTADQHFGALVTTYVLLLAVCGPVLTRFTPTRPAAPARRPQPSVVLARSPHHNDRAVRVMQQSLADRPQQKADEPTTPPRTDHHQLRGPARLDQRLPRPAVHHPVLHRDIRIPLPMAGQRLGQQPLLLPGQRARRVRVRLGRILRRRHRRVPRGPGMHRHQGSLAQRRLGEGELHRPLAQIRTVHTHHDRTVRTRLLVHHQYRAPAVRRQMHRRRSDQQPDEPTHAPGTDHDQLGRTRLRLQDRQRLTGDHGITDVHVRCRLPRTLNGLRHQTLHHVPDPALRRTQRRRTQRHMHRRPQERMHHPKPCPTQPCLPSRRLDSGKTRRRPVHTDDHQTAHRASQAQTYHRCHFPASARPHPAATGPRGPSQAPSGPLPRRHPRHRSQGGVRLRLPELTHALHGRAPAGGRTGSRLTVRVRWACPGELSTVEVEVLGRVAVDVFENHRVLKRTDPTAPESASSAPLCLRLGLQPAGQGVMVRSNFAPIRRWPNTRAPPAAPQ